LSTVFDIKKWNDQLCLFIASSESMKGFFKQQTLKEPKLVWLDRVLSKWFTAMHFEVKAVTRPVVIQNVMHFYDEMKITVPIL
jgi:hypothetical protein